MTECREQCWLFQDLGTRKAEVDFGGGYLASDGGGLILRELERHSGLLRELTDCFFDYRNPCYIEHSVQELLSQPIHGLVLGYEDFNDHDYLGGDRSPWIASAARAIPWGMIGFKKMIRTKRWPLIRPEPFEVKRSGH